MVAEVPLQIVVLPVTAAMGRAMTVTAFVTVAPRKPTALVSVTVTSPLLAPTSR